MSRRRRVTAAVALGAGTALVTGAGLVVGRRAAVRRFERRPDAQADEPVGSLRGVSIEVIADDGVPLHAEIDGADRTDVAIVFCHGWTVTQDSWHYQRAALRGEGRLVFWDHRGHGRSGPTRRAACNVPQLGTDLAAVIRRCVPDGTPIILVGHSMGGITIMSYADLYPAEFGSSVVGAALLCTSSGNVGRPTLGLSPSLAAGLRMVLPSSVLAGRLAAPVLERVRPVLRDSSVLVADRIAFGPHASPSSVVFLQRMMAQSRIATILDFFDMLRAPGSFATLAALKEVETVVIGAENDLLTPLSNSLTIAAGVPGARLEVIPEAGHMAMLERPDVVAAHLKSLIARVTPGSVGGGP